MTGPEAGDGPRQFPCAKCGADVEFVPAVGLKCPFCGHEGGYPQSADQCIEELDFESYLARSSRGFEVPGQREIKCTQCGGISEIAGEVASLRCAFCGIPMVVEDRPSDDVVRPEAVVPFQVDLPACRAAFEKWVASLWFAPGELKRLKETDRLVGVYRPYWTFDSQTHSFYTGSRGEHYWDTEWYTTTVNGRSVRRSRTVRKTRWYPASGQVAHFFDDILVLGGRPLEWSSDYDLSGLEPYDPGFLAGWQAEKYSIDPEGAWPSARGEIDRGIEDLVRRDIGGDEQRIHEVRTSYNAVRFKHVLLPVWVATYHYRGKAYRFQVNGQTGAVHGQRPWSFWKISFLVLGILAAIGGLVALLASK